MFAGYTVLRVLGAGGMGRVYLARHPRLPREDALKVLPSDLTTDAEYRARFLREADLAAGLSHPHIVRIHDRGEEDGHLWISMDYVAGIDLGRLLQDSYPGGMPLDEVVPIITAVASALDYSHHRGLLHRDVKPANILLAEPDGQAPRVFLADFGIARPIEDATRLTATDMMVGTAAYAAPEQLKGASVDGCADQYALACTAFQLLTGMPPYAGSNSAVVITKHLSAPSPSIGAYHPLLAGLDPVFAKALAKDPSHRFSSCGEFAEHLGRQLGPGLSSAVAIPFPDTQPEIDVTAPARTAPARPTGRAVRRHPGFLIGAVASIVLLVAGGIFAIVKLTRHHQTAGAPHSASTPTNPAPAAANTGPFTGVYRVQFGPVTKLAEAPAPGAMQSTDTYAIRSMCGSAGCVATATRLSGEVRLAPSTVFDEVGGRWVAVTIGSAKCRDSASRMWEVFTLQPGPNGTFTGEYRGAASNSCAEKRTVTFTRTGDVDVNSLPDPAALPARVVSPAEALHGRYHITRNFSTTMPQQQQDETVTTDCLRSGDQCMSYFYSPTSDTPLVFSDGNWILDLEHEENVPGCISLYVKTTGQYPLPQPMQDPITRLTGHGRHQQSGSCAVSVDFDETLTRTGD
ncbi:Serine/threonine-protein kinase PknF [Mycobacterium kansasii]|uniref:non-specific serine/threonine protein kinase n=1 Tax=Mycobacterium kansasii TaxID=1768 RepID=A0A653EJV8_MYCKA|nr:serine/threonine-protein kinase pknF [Mycobacterium kansasii 824]VAZ60784.1 Serine/threonine-protein kinase PknF [Mycobacterium kansasii]VAZ67106.1 Serine/threonine-protein kinase PknF [Mycobacterium kansasii]VAZ76136.1 Serine/threonine-protein kinase PknF [Mycobacterium kansasii]VTO97813.1 Serine/threonine-protein kinase PknF [Mycobacterium kansasii]